jgi:hypothetical protein
LQKADKKPKLPILRDKVDRRASLMKMQIEKNGEKCRPPKPKSWTLDKTKEWLSDNPVTDAKELEFITVQEGKYYADLMRAFKERITMNASSPSTS